MHKLHNDCRRSSVHARYLFKGSRLLGILVSGAIAARPFVWDSDAIRSRKGSHRFTMPTPSRSAFSDYSWIAALQPCEGSGPQSRGQVNHLWNSPRRAANRTKSSQCQTTFLMRSFAKPLTETSLHPQQVLAGTALVRARTDETISNLTGPVDLDRCAWSGHGNRITADGKSRGQLGASGAATPMLNSR
jgi:hypothetical protein